jgi:hypothetical protein
MDAESQSLEAFLRIVHEVEWTMPGSPLSLSVVYAGDEQQYWGWAPAKDSPFTPSGLRDPALGNTGPIEFSAIEMVTVNGSPRHLGQSEEYRAKFSAVQTRAAMIRGIQSGRESVRFRRRVVP